MIVSPHRTHNCAAVADRSRVSAQVRLLFFPPFPHRGAGLGSELV